MRTDRMAAFSDGVLAIVITIMVLELRVPHGKEVGVLRPLIPVFAAYVMSFLYIAIYWNNHHHMLHLAERVSGRVLWANMHLLFWLSLIPFATGWMRENDFAAQPTALYGIVLLGAACAWYVLQKALVADGKNPKIREALGRDFKAKLSLGMYLIAIPLALLVPMASLLTYAAVAVIWLIPDRRFEAKHLER